MESFEPSPVIKDEQIEQQIEQTILQQRLDRASERVNEASDKFQEKSNTALRVIQHQRPPEGKSDWTDILPEKRSALQKVAAATGGIVTPGNVITSYGHYNMFKASKSAARGDYVSAVWEAFKGRSPDTVDGAAAHLTKTKSPIGAAYDSLGDNVLISGMTIILALKGKIPADVAGIFAKQRAQIVYENARKRAIGAEINPTRKTKAAMKDASFYIGGTLLAEAQKQKGNHTKAAIVALATKVVGEMAILKGEEAIIELHNERKKLEAAQISPEIQ